jgi:plasmid stabilization system protein ParE
VPTFFSENALSDLENIAAYIGRSSPLNARAFLRRVEAAVDRISRAPTAYPVRDDLPVAGLHTRSEPPCIIVFRVQEGGAAEVVRIAHDRQDLAALLTVLRDIADTG